MPEHIQKLMIHNGQCVLIDEELVDLLPLLWERGITTRWSCQGRSMYKDPTCHSNEIHLGYISMARDDASMEFMLLMLDIPLLKGKKRAFFKFEFSYHPEQKNRIAFRFPNQHIPYLIEYLQTHKKQRL